MKQELSPLEDRGVLANVTAPDGATLDYTNRYARELERMGQPYKEFDRIFANVGNPTVSQGSVFYRTVDWDERSAPRWTSRASCSPSWRAARRQRLSDHAAVAGPGLSRAAGQLRDPDLRQLREPQAAWCAR
jgi:multidrug efflux pump subunit AcrB